MRPQHKQVPPIRGSPCERESRGLALTSPTFFFCWFHHWQLYKDMHELERGREKTVKNTINNCSERVIKGVRVRRGDTIQAIFHYWIFCYFLMKYAKWSLLMIENKASEQHHILFSLNTNQGPRALSSYILSLLNTRATFSSQLSRSLFRLEFISIRATASFSHSQL